MPIVERIKGIILKPKEEWEVIAGETSSTADLLKNYALPLAAIGAVAGFIGSSFIGVSAGPLGTFRVPMATGLVGAAVGLGISIGTVFILGLIIDALAPKFGGEKNSGQALKVAVYSFTPGWVVAVLQVLPFLRALSILGGLAAAVWGVYILYLGLPRLMKCPQDKAVTYTVVVVLCGIGISLVAGIITGAIVGAGMVASGGLPTRM
jgi:hypothetical protein